MITSKKAKKLVLEQEEKFSKVNNLVHLIMMQTGLFKFVKRRCVKGQRMSTVSKKLYKRPVKTL